MFGTHMTDEFFAVHIGGDLAFLNGVLKVMLAEGTIDQNITGGDYIDIDDLFVSKTHDRTVAVVLGDLLDRHIKILISRRRHFVGACFFFSFRRHIEVPLSTLLVTVRQEEKRRMNFRY